MEEHFWIKLTKNVDLNLVLVSSARATIGSRVIICQSSLVRVYCDVLSSSEDIFGCLTVIFRPNRIDTFKIAFTTSENQLGIFVIDICAIVRL